MEYAELPTIIKNEFHKICDLGDEFGMELTFGDFKYTPETGLTIDGEIAREWIQEATGVSTGWL